MSNPYCWPGDNCQIDPDSKEWFYNHFCGENYVRYFNKQDFSAINDFQTLTKEHAQVIRALRISGCTWGRIAEIMEIVTNTNEEWGQLDGKIMCRKAELFFDDIDFEKEKERQRERLKCL